MLEQEWTEASSSGPPPSKQPRRGRKLLVGLGIAFFACMAVILIAVLLTIGDEPKVAEQEEPEQVIVIVTATSEPTAVVEPTEPPTSTPRPTRTPQPTQKSEPTVSRQEIRAVYWNEIEPHWIEMQITNDAVVQLSDEIANDPMVFFDSDRLSEFSAQVNRMERSAQVVDSYDPPEEMRELHRTIHAVIQSCTTTYQLFDEAVWQTNVDDAVWMMENVVSQSQAECQRALDEASEALDREIALDG